MSLRIPIRIMVDTRARMFPLLWDGVGEDTVITTTDSTAGIAMEGIQEGIVGGIRGIRGFRDGIGKRAFALTSATRRWLIVIE